jgi:hypothetical protein
VFSHVHRSINGATHILARTCDVSSTGFVLDYAPECIRETLCIDVKYSIKCCVPSKKRLLAYYSVFNRTIVVFCFP